MILPRGSQSRNVTRTGACWSTSTYPMQPASSRATRVQCHPPVAPSCRPLHLVKPFENPAELGLRDSRTVVDHFHAVSALILSDPHFDMPPVWRELDAFPTSSSERSRSGVDRRRDRACPLGRRRRVRSIGWTLPSEHSRRRPWRARSDRAGRRSAGGPPPQAC